MNKDKKKIIKILKLINKIFKNYEEVDSQGRGRKQIYGEMELFKIFIIMKLTNTNTIKGIWRLITDDKQYKKLCGIEKDIDRTTLNRRLGDKIKDWFE